VTQKWEYNVLTAKDGTVFKDDQSLDSPVEAYLNVLGAQSWELVGIASQNLSAYTLILKRPISDAFHGAS
jgi:hypothetical protein